MKRMPIMLMGIAYIVIIAILIITGYATNSSFGGTLTGIGFLTFLCAAITLNLYISPKSKFKKMISELIEGNGGQCSNCKAELQPIVDNAANSVYDAFRRMGTIAGSITINTAREQVIKQGLKCTCGKEIRSF